MADNDLQSLPEQSRQEPNIVPPRRPLSTTTVTGGAAASVTIPANAVLIEISPVTGSVSDVFMDFDKTAVASTAQYPITGTRHYPVPAEDRPTTASVISAENFYVVIY
jgi:hypothetical protein